MPRKIISDIKIQDKDSETIRISQNILLKVDAGTPSGTPTLLRLISPFGESDGRFVHTPELNSE